MTSKSMITIAALGVVLAVGSTTSAFAWSKSFAGTRDQVRAACTNVGGTLFEGHSTTTCANDKKGTIVTCNDDSRCGGSGPGPRLTYGFLAEIGVLHGLVLTDEALARTVTKFRGTRDQVRAACAQVGGDLIEGSNYTMCENSKNDTTVECNDKGNCIGGSHPKRLGSFDTAVGLPPQSLSEQSSGPATPAPAGAPEGTPDIFF